MDPSVVSRTFQQLQQVKGFYQFPSVLSVDRYLLPGAQGAAGPGPGGPRAVRAAAGQGNWINTHLVYTHGFGIVAAKENSIAADGTPAFVESDIPPHGELGNFQPRVYFGPAENNYAIVGGPNGRARDRTRLPQYERRRPAELHLQGQRRRPHRLRAQPPALRGQVP